MIEKNMTKKLIKMVWTYTNKVVGGISKKSKLHDFRSCEKKETKKDIRRSYQEGYLN